jgi:hypothetical protein
MKINTLEEIKILKAASSKYLLNDVIAGQNDPVYKLPPLISDLNYIFYNALTKMYS